MTDGLAFEQGWEWTRGDPTCDRNERLLAADGSLQQATTLAALAERAAAEAMSLCDAAAAVVYLEGTAPAFSGDVDAARSASRTGLLRQLVAGPLTAPYTAFDRGRALVARFASPAARGALLAERPDPPFSGADGYLLAAFAQQVRALAMGLAALERVRQAEQVEEALVGTTSDGMLLIRDGQVLVVNGPAEQLLGMDGSAVIGSSIRRLWPELARLLAPGLPLDGKRVVHNGNELLVTVQHFRDCHPEQAIVKLAASHAPVPYPRIASRVGAQAGFELLIGRSPALVQVRALCRVASESTSSLLIEGESGVGKEVLAQAVHASSGRAGGPFIAVHCAAIPRDLIESELFGYERGAFTGADPHGHPGKFELAEGGTLLLDDVVELPAEMQPKLLRVLQERTVTRLGARRPRPVDARVVATTNVPLRQAVESGRFRADLFYRLDVLHITMPPLRDRRGDVRALAEHFLRKYAPLHDRHLKSLGPEALRALQSYSWPGNVRELEHWIESEVHFAPPGDTWLQRLVRDPASVDVRLPVVQPLRPIDDIEREVYGSAIAATAGDVKRVARELGISRGKAYRKLRQFGLLPR